jgi:hypothetical protein
MRERIKSLILFLLVTTSVVLTGRLLFGLPALETAAPPAYEQLVFGELRPMAEHVLPHLRLGEDEQWLVLAPWDEGHRDAWGILLDLIRYADTPQTALLLEERDDLSAHAVFENPVQMGWWLPNALSADFYVTELAWFAAEPLIVWFREKGGSWYTSQLTRLPEDWETQLLESFAKGTDVRQFPIEDWGPLTVAPEAMILIPRELPELASYFLKQEELDYEKLLRSIFVSTAMIRRIEERDGAVIYTDGQRGLRLFDHGEVEYTSPKSEPGLEQMEVGQALRRSDQYLQLMGGWPQDLYIQSYSPQERTIWNIRQGDTYTITFKSVQRGVRLESSEPPIVLRFSDRGVIDYRRQLTLLDHPVGTPQKMIDPLLASGEVAALLEISGVDVFLVQVYPAYYIGAWPKIQSAATPVWVFRFNNGQSIMIHGHTGEPVTPQI